MQQYRQLHRRHHSKHPLLSYAKTMYCQPSVTSGRAISRDTPYHFVGLVLWSFICESNESFYTDDMLLLRSVQCYIMTFLDL